MRRRANDLDLTLYSLRKFARLATKGNPSVPALLWLPSYITKTPLGEELINLRGSFVSRSAGYLRSQRMKLTGERTKRVGGKIRNARTEIGPPGVRVYERGSIPLGGWWLENLRQVRQGALSLNEVLKLIDEAEKSLTNLVEACKWKSDVTKVNEWLVRAHFEAWDV